MCRHGDRTVSFAGKMDSSPLRLLPGKPSTPTMSPRLTLLCSSVNSSIDRPEFLRMKALLDQTLLYVTFARKLLDTRTDSV